MNLKPQTVYIPNDKNPTGVYHSTQSSVPVRKYTDQISLSKEELVELLSKAFIAGNERGWSGYPNTDNHTKSTKEQFINNLFNS